MQKDYKQIILHSNGVEGGSGGVNRATEIGLTEQQLC